MLIPEGQEAGPQWEDVAAVTEPPCAARKALHIRVVPAAGRQTLSQALVTVKHLGNNCRFVHQLVLSLVSRLIK